MIPLALSAAGWAATAAVAGALVGATAGGLVDWLLQAKREHKVARTAARLVIADLRTSDVRLKGIIERGEMLKSDGFPTAAWIEYRAILAGRLERDDFKAVSSTMATMKALDELFPSSPVGHSVKMDEANLKGFAVIRKELARTHNALAAIGDLDEVGEFIAESSPLLAALLADDPSRDPS